MMHLITALFMFTSFLPLQTAWQEFSSTEGGFSVLMPRSPDLNKMTVQTKTGPVDAFSFLAIDENDNEFMATYSEYPTMTDGESRAENIFNGARDGLVVAQKGKLLSDARVALAGYPGRSVVIESSDGLIHKTVFYLVNQRFYQLKVETRRFREDAPIIEVFFNSFRLLPATRT